MGAHVRPSGARYVPQRPKPSQTSSPTPAIPQHERVTFLAQLAKVIAHMEGIVTVFADVQGYVVLNVIPLGVPGQAVTVGCRYCCDGAWWFYDTRTGESIRPANDTKVTAHLIRTKMEEAAAA